METLINSEIEKKYLAKIAKIEKGKRAAIVTHKVADPDALACALAIKHDLFLRDIEADIFNTGGFSHAQNITMVNRLKIDVYETLFFEENKSNYSLIIFCDTGKENSSLPDCKPDMIWDHHARSNTNGNCLNVCEKVGAASTIVYFLLKKLGTVLTPEVATALFVGINVDTKDLTSEQEVTDFDKQAHLELRPLIDWPLFSAITFRFELNRQLLKLMGTAFVDIDYEDYLAIVGLHETVHNQKAYYGYIADYVFRIPEVRFVVVLGVEDGKIIRASIRTDLDTVRLEEFFREVFEISTNVKIKDSQPSGGFRIGSGAAQIPFSEKECAKWQIATKEEKEVLFKLSKRYYKQRIKEALGMDSESKEEI